MFGKKQPDYHIPARVKAYGRARVEIAQRAQTRSDWDALWKPPQQYFPFEWGEPWKQCVEYKVDDFTAEVGFLIDVLGLPVNAFNSDYAMFTSPNHDFFFSVVQVLPGSHSTPPDALRLQFMVADIFATVQELQRRGIHLEQEARPIYEGSQQWVASFHTPHGILMEIWGMVEMVAQAQEPETPAELAGLAAAEAESFEEEQIIPAESTSFTSVTSETEEPEGEEVEEQAVPLPGWLDRSHQPDVVETEDELEEEADQPDPQTTPSLDLYKADRIVPSQPERKVPAQPAPALQTFQNGQAMLDHLQQKKAQRQFPQADRLSNSSTTRPQTAPPPSNNLNFRPAPKNTSEEEKDSIWDQVDQDVEYVDNDEAAQAEDDYHYKPISLNPKP